MQVHVDHGLPLLPGELLDRHGRRSGARVVEDHVEPAETFLDGRKQLVHCLGTADIRGYRKRPRAVRARELRGFVQPVATAPGKSDRMSVLQERVGNATPDSGTGSGDEYDLLIHEVFAPALLIGRVVRAVHRLQPAGACYHAVSRHGNACLGDASIWARRPIPVLRSEEESCRATRR